MDSLDDIPLEYLYFNNNYTGFEPSDYCPISIYYDDDYYLTSRCDIHGIKKLPDELYEDYGPNNFCFQSSLLKNSVIDILSDYKDVLTARCYKITECNINTLSYSVEIFTRSFDFFLGLSVLPKLFFHFSKLIILSFNSSTIVFNSL